MAKLSKEEIIEAIKELSVLELNDLVKACEEEFGVSAAAGVVVAAGPAAGGAAEEEKTEFDVELTSFGEKKMDVIKVIGARRRRSQDGKGRRFQGRSKRYQGKAGRGWSNRNPEVISALKCSKILCNTQGIFFCKNSS